MLTDEQMCSDSPPVRSPIQEATSSSSSLAAEPSCALVPSSSVTLPHILDSLILPQQIDKTTVQELLISLHGFLNITGLNDVADLLKRKLEINGLIPQRYAFDGRPRQQSLDEFLSQFQPYSTDLLQILSRLNEQINREIPPSISNLKVRLFAGSRNSLIRQRMGAKRPFMLASQLARPNVKSLETCRNTSVLMAREFGMLVSPRLLQRKQAVANINDNGKLHGHILPVFCVTFDQTGRYVLTGGDDKLIKVWDTVTSRLRYTFRGHTSEISDLSINAENNCLASGSNDKSVRVWSTSDGQPLMVYRKHTALITMVKFTDFVDNDVRYLVSTGNDCTVVFYKYELSTLKFDPEPIRYEEREVPSARGLVLNASFGGNFVVMGDSANMIHIYKLSANTVDRIAEFRAHEERVDSLVFANSHLRFATGSKDGVAKVWEFDSGDWTSTELRIQDQQRQQNSTQQVTRKTSAYKLTMLGWSGDDTRVITTGSDCLVRVWNWKSGQMLRKMDGHSHEVFVIKTHPIHADLVFTAGHDGLLMLWDITTGQNLWKHKNQLDMHSSVLAIFDLAVSPQGDRFAYVDINGMLTLMAVGDKRTTTNHLSQQFFSTDYDEIFFDDNGFAQDIDEVPAHLAAPPLLVNADSHPYAPDIQRWVPGRDFVDSTRVENPWSVRNILPTINLKEQLLDRQAKSRMELEEYEAGKPLDEAEIERRRRLEEERRRQAHLDRLEKQRNRRNRNRQETNERMRQLMHPQYVLDDTYTDNDSTYSGGSDQSTVDDLEMESNLSQDEEENEDFDSDYEEGGVERETVFRSRSAVTVTGRRKKNLRSRRDIDDNVPLEDQPSTSQGVVAPPQKTTRYGRQTKPPTRIENEYDQTGRRRKRSLLAASNSASLPVVQHNTRQRTRRAQIDSSDPPSPEAVVEDETQEIKDDERDLYPTSSRNPQRRKRRISSRQSEPDLDALDDEIENDSPVPTTFEESLSPISEQFDEDMEDEELEQEETKPSRRSRRAARSPPKKRAKRKCVSSSRSVSRNSDSDIEEKPRMRGRILKSGRESRPPKTLAAERDFQSRRRKKGSSPQRRSARQANQHYNLRYNSSASPVSAENSNFSTREVLMPRRRGKVRYTELSEERSLSPVPGLSYIGAEPRSQRLRDRIKGVTTAVSIQSYPEWMTCVERRRFPYVAQLGDKVVYFVQGHRNYIKGSGIQFGHQFAMQVDAYNPEEYFIVTDINYTTKKESTIVQNVEFAHLDSNGKPDGKKFKFCFHDLNDYPDFLVLKQHYDKSCSYNFKPGDRVEMVLSEIYTGIIDAHQPCDDDKYPNSEWNAIRVRWEDGEESPCAIWDIQPAKPNRVSKEPVAWEDVDEVGKYEPEAGDWPLEDEDETPAKARDRHLNQCKTAINELCELNEVKPFIDMVDLNVYKEYPKLIKRPVFLQLISERIRNLYYRSLASLKFDIQLIAKNAHQFNERGSDIVTNSDLLVTTLFDMLDDFDIPSAQTHFQQLSQIDFKSRHNDQIIPDSVNYANANGLSTSSATTAADSWQAQCHQMMNSLIRTHLTNQPETLRESIDRLCTDMRSNRFESPVEFKDELKELLNEETEDLSKKETRYIALTRLINDLDKQFDPIISQYQRAQHVRQTKYRQAAPKTEAYDLRKNTEKRVLRSQTQPRHDEPTTSKRRRPN